MARLSDGINMVNGGMVLLEKVSKIRQIGNKLEFETVNANFIKNYFGLHDNLPKIFSQITKDKQIEAAVKKFEGLHILRQDLWECLISSSAPPTKTFQQ